MTIPFIFITTRNQKHYFVCSAMTVLKAGTVHFLITMVLYILVKGSLGLSYTGVEVTSPVANIAVPIWNIIIQPLASLESVQYMLQGSGHYRFGVFAIFVTNSAIWGVLIAVLLRGVEHVKDRLYAG